jgi:ATP-dependent Clp protease ATP-binding subunit ClpC
VFERFTDGARRVVALAQDEARLLGHSHIGTEHLLLGLLQEPGGVAAGVLAGLGIEVASARGAIGVITGTSDRRPSSPLVFTPRSKTVLELSLREALGLGHQYIGSEHILLGLVQEGEGVGAQVLVAQGAGLATIRGAVIGLLPTSPGPLSVPDHPPSVGSQSGSPSGSGGRDELGLLKLYLADIGQYPLLATEDEVRLAQIIEQGRNAAQQLNAASGLSAATRTELRLSLQQGRDAERDLVDLRVLVGGFVLLLVDGWCPPVGVRTP